MLDRAPGIDDPERNRLCGGEETLVVAGRWMTKIGPVLVLAFIAWFIRTGKHTAGVFAASYGVALLLFFSTSQQGMTNYYFLVGQSFFLAAGALPRIPLRLNYYLNAEKGAAIRVQGALH
jgi:hypothetical protein